MEIQESRLKSEQEILHYLKTPTIVAIADYHKKPKNRQFVMSLLTSRPRILSAFFFEWQRNDSLNTYLSRIPFGRGGTNLKGVIQNLRQYFVGMAEDARPSLLELVATAVSNNIIAIACDMDYREATKELGGKEQFLFQPTGLSVRDNSTAKYIKENIERSRIGVGRLLLWGAGHFTENLSYGDTLHQCLEDEELDVKVFGLE